jgi:hypothetical protein
MKLAKLTILMVLSCSCSRSDVPKTQFERSMLDAVLREAKQRNVAVPTPYSFRIYEDRMIIEMKGSIKVWVVEVFPKGVTNHPAIQAEVNPTNFVIEGFSSLGRDSVIEPLMRR